MIMNANDQPVEEIEHLDCATSLDLYNAVSVVRELGGAQSAHVDRNPDIISNLGLIPDDLDFIGIVRYTTNRNIS